MKSLSRSARRVQEDSGAFLPTVPLANMRAIEVTPDRLERFWGHVVKSDDCWEWSGGRNACGYGVFFLTRRGGPREALAHRFSYTACVGPIPDGLVIDHLCRTRACVRPAHLEAVTQGVNASRSNPVTTHCPQNHEYTPENTYANAKKCKICTRARQRAYYRAKVSA